MTRPADHRDQRTPGRCSRGQATVELACVLPVLLLLALSAVQVGLVVRDRVVVVHAARAAGRATVVDPSTAAATAAVRRQGAPGDRATVSLHGDTRPGGLVTVTVRLRPTRVPVVGRLVGSTVLEERLVVMVEGAR